MEKKNKIITASLVIGLLVCVLLLFANIEALVSKERENSKMTILSLDNYQVGQMVESGDFMLLNRKTNTIDYCIKDSLSKTIYLQIMKVDQLTYNQYFDKNKPKEKK